ncbi:GapA-binding peptide SR1P [Alteribacillus sp. HJP-4]
METIVCQTCDQIIEHIEGEKVATLYSSSCKKCDEKRIAKK